MTNRKLKVEGMSCNHCVQTIQNAVGQLPGVRKIAVNLEQKEVSVDYDENMTGIGDVRSKIKEAGFEVADKD